MNLTNNLLVLAAEVWIILTASFIINWLADLSINLLNKVSWIEGQTERIYSWRGVVRRFIILTTVLMCLVTIGINGVLIYQGKDLYQVQYELVRRIPTQLWINLGTALLKSISLLMLVKLILPQLKRGIERIYNRVKTLEQVFEDRERLDRVFKDFINIFINSVWLGSIVLSVTFFNPPEFIDKYLFVGLKIYITIALGLLLIKGISIAIDILTRILLNYAIAKERQDLYDRIYPLIPLFNKCFNCIIYIGIIALVAQSMQFT